MQEQIEKLKHDIASDYQSRNALEIEELAARLEDLSHGLCFEMARSPDTDKRLEATTRSYWSALILARNAIELAESNRRMTCATDQAANPRIPHPACS